MVINYISSIQLVSTVLLVPPGPDIDKVIPSSHNETIAW